MSVINLLTVTLSGPQFEKEFLSMVKQSLEVNSTDPNCTFIDAGASSLKPNTFFIASIWKTEAALMEWYRSPFHLELRQRGMEGMIKGYETNLGSIMPEKSHTWHVAAR
jgi:hypothetical protein